MHTLVALLLAAAAACAIARPPRPTAPPPNTPQVNLMQSQMETDQQEVQYLSQFVIPYLAYDEQSLGRFNLPAPENNYLADWPRIPGSVETSRRFRWRHQSDPGIGGDKPIFQDIYRIKHLEEDYRANPYDDAEFFDWLPSDSNLISRLYDDIQEQVDYDAEPIKYIDYMKSLDMPQSWHTPKIQDIQPLQLNAQRFHVEPKDEKKKLFALTPSEVGYYDVEDRVLVPEMTTTRHEAKPLPRGLVLEPPRQTRQNPNLSKQKHLVPDLRKLKAGMYDVGGSHELSHSSAVESTATVVDPADSIYGVALIAAVGAALTMAIVGFAFGWYTLSKKAKAAADVDYPAYGVTGPTIDSSGDRKLAHSAHMYHYQHQKQQIIAMERNGLEQRVGSVSDPESEEENEEGDYTVYECPGFATTGDMEVKNPLFSEDPTPATPGKCEMVKPQPKD